ncbi:MAG: nucleotidyl transferase AbiEii/AbiGii toxin family protein [Blastocatellia bacterium]|nr:nucleotidyl transferase AbiEii/AbiGii toxin family protein [Blastocatellia bacterium]
MSSFWKDFFGVSANEQHESAETGGTAWQPVAAVNPVSETQVPPHEVQWYPNSYRAASKSVSEVGRPKVFEPALQHYGRAFRLGDPLFQSQEEGAFWYQARQQVMGHLLLLIEESAWKDHLVLRGSVLLKAWLGDATREPGDIDWVFRPATVPINSPMAHDLFEWLKYIAAKNSQAGDAIIQVADIAVDDIWTYERANGRRILFPWKVDGLPPGEIQMDVVFQETLPSPPVPVPVHSEQGSGGFLWAASPELSLAWKLLWLETDCYPQGKDLFDATLLAERTSLPFELFEKVMHSGECYCGTQWSETFPLGWAVDWDNFKQEYPWVQGEVDEWKNRLVKAITPTFAASGTGRLPVLPKSWRA